MITVFVPRITVLFLLLAVAGCMDQPEGLKAKADANSDNKSLWPAFGSAIAPRNSEVVLIPFGVDSNESLNRLSYGGISSGFVSSAYSSVDSYSYSASGDFFDTGQIHWNNVVFYNKKTGQSHLLLDRRAVIGRYMAPYDPDNKEVQRPQYFLFAIADADTNGDGLINENDALSLYVSDASGQGLTRVTPPMTHFEGVVTDPDDHTLYVQIRLDAKGYHNFTADDPTTFLHVDPLHPAEGTPVFANDLRQRAFRIVVP